MKIKTLFGTALIWAMLVCIGLSVSKRMQKMTHRSKSDKVAVDEQPSQYPAIDLEDFCKQAKNPKCEAIVDNYCHKTCNANLCAQYGSVRAMCRLMCEAEDLLPQCSKMGPSKKPEKKLPNLQQSYQMYYPPFQ